MLRAAFSKTSAVVTCAIALACQEVSHPPNANLSCGDSGRCGEPPPVGGGVGGSAGQAADAGVDAATTSISGTLALVTGDDFTTAIAFTDPARIRMEDATGAAIEASYDGSSFTLQGVRSAVEVWTTVTPSGGASDAMTTLQPVDTTGAGPLQLLVVSRSVLDLVYGLLTIPSSPLAGDAQIVLRFLDPKTRYPVPGVSVTATTAETIAYDAAGSYSDAVDATGTAGIAIVVNVPALAESTLHTLQISTPSGAATLEIPAQENAVTLADVLVEP